MDRRTFHILAKRHLEDARCLLRANRPEGAYYLAGYAVECALKACIAKNTKKHDFPSEPKLVQKMYTHNLQELLKLAGLELQLQSAAPSGSPLDKNFAIVYRWSEQSRYQPVQPSKASELLAAIDDPTSGVFKWLSRNW